jgi:hypothetical protein
MEPSRGAHRFQHLKISHKLITNRLHINVRFNQSAPEPEKSQDTGYIRLNLIDLIGIIQPPTRLYILIGIPKTSSFMNLIDLFADGLKISSWQRFICHRPIIIPFVHILPLNPFLPNEIENCYQAHDKRAAKNSCNNADNCASAKS